MIIIKRVTREKDWKKGVTDKFEQKLNRPFRLSHAPCNTCALTLFIPTYKIFKEGISFKTATRAPAEILKIQLYIM